MWFLLWFALTITPAVRLNGRSQKEFSIKFTRDLVLTPLLPVLVLAGNAAGRAKAPGPAFTVRLDAPANEPAKGRLIILAEPATPHQITALAEPKSPPEQA